MALFLTSDSHFGHSGVLAMSKRPFTAGEIRLHDAMLIEAWNARVGRDDDVWHLGDFALGLNRRRLRDVFDQLNGHKRLVRGNPADAQSLDVGVDCWSYAPATLPEIRARLAAAAAVEPEERRVGRAAIEDA
jgi:calcineurin-like phosphoesterase family protein